MLGYNVFRTRHSDIYCLVPEDKPVPAFVGSGKWEFAAKVDSEMELPRAARIAVRFNGFYMFHPFEAAKFVH